MTRNSPVLIPNKAGSATDFVRAASPSASEQSLRAVARRMRRWKRWLNIKHPYSDVVRELGSSGIVDEQKLGEYIAASAPLHLADGWNYLSRAFDAIVRGDRHSAYHLAYYAELRAAMSLLATEGIGIFKRRHIALSASFVPTEFTRANHAATWEVLSAWSDEPGTAERLLGSIQLEDKSLSEWLTAIGALPSASRVLAREWLAAWSLDLRLVAADRERRNEISYRPTRIRPLPPVDANLELTAPIFQSWEVLEPFTADGAGVLLDSSLLRRAMSLAVKEKWCRYGSLEAAMVALKNDMSQPGYEALYAGNASADAILSQAEEAGTVVATPVLARALLMLRLASARSASLLADAGVSKDDLEFWWEALGTDMGLWESSGELDAFADLWRDVEEAISQARERMAAIPNGTSVYAVSRVLSREVSLTQFSRAPLWLLGFGG